MTRTVTLVLVDPAGEPLGALPPFESAIPWWPEVGDFPQGVTVLRLLHADRPAQPGGHVTYLAESANPPPGLTPIKNLNLTPQPLRLPYARPGGPASSLNWAYEVLGEQLPAKQIRTWNLSSIWCLGVPAAGVPAAGVPAAGVRAAGEAKGGQIAWLKQVPPFFAHEPAAIRLVSAVASGLVPELLAAGPEGRMLLAHIPGTDGYGAGPETCEAIAAAFHPIQAHFATHLDDLLGTIPDGRAIDYARVAEPYYTRIPGLQALIEGLPRRLAALADCGLPDTLVHGDLHTGNTRQDETGKLTIMDWGDCLVGNPAVDILRLTERLEDPAPILTSWAQRWQQTVPGCDPLRAVDLIRPVAALRSAAVYQSFLDNIEPDEHPYHAADVPELLAAATSA